MSKAFDIVIFNPDGDGVTALYQDGVFKLKGDDYHDKIDQWLDGFQNGFAEADGVEATFTTHYVRDEKTVEKICELAEMPPKKLSKLKKLLQSE